MKILSVTTALIALVSIGCGSKSSTSEVPASTASTAILSVAQVPTTVSAGGTQTITPSGGTAPYTFVLSDATTGTLSAASGTSTVFTASATATFATVVVTDAKGVVNYFPIVFTSSSTSTTTTAATVCAGNYNISVNGRIGTMTILSSTSGRLLGSISLPDTTNPAVMGVSSISGTCTSAGAISFLNQYSGSQYTGTFGTTNGQLMMSGTWLTITGGTYPWSAVYTSAVN